MQEVELTSEARISKARELFDKACDETVDRRSRKQFWGELWMANKTWKKNWAALGFTPREIERIKTMKPDWI